MKNRAESVERRLTIAILRGEYGVGARLPTVRELAVQFAVNPSTVHRALKGLEATRLITPRRGSGVVINTPNLVSDLSLLPAWFEALIDEPNKAAKLLEELLQLRRLLAADLITRHRDQILKHEPQLALLAKEFRATPRSDVSLLRKADVALTQFLLGIVGNTVGQLAMNIMPQVYERVPEVEEACYYAFQKKDNSLLSDMFEAIASISDEHELRLKVEQYYLELDKVSVKRYKLLLVRRNKQNS